MPVRFDNSTPSKSLDYLLATVHWLAIPTESRERSIARVAEQIAEWLTNFLNDQAAPLPQRMARMQSSLVTTLEPPRRRRSMLVGAAMLLALVAAVAFATGHLPFSKNTEAKDPITPNTPPNPRSLFANGQTRRGEFPASQVNPPSGYAGVNHPPAGPPPATPLNSTANQPRGTFADPRMQNPSGMYGPPPPPPPQGPPMSQYGNGPGSGPPPDGRYPPPPPPPGGGGPMFDPPNGPGPDGLPNPRGPRP